jgi:hypothetical protein
MQPYKLENILEGFDFNLLNHPEFKEDSVREEIIVPIIKGLGYSAGLPNQIIRSRKLLHPYVSIGSQRKIIYIIPDYLFEVKGKPAWIMDAKSPSESTINSVHVEQAYSYAIHSEVRVNYFALCNGVYFTLYSINNDKPLLHFPTRALPGYWSQLKEFLLPDNVFTNAENNIRKDFGLHLKRLGFDDFPSLLFPNVPSFHIGQLDDDKYTMSSGLEYGDSSYVVTFDFHKDNLPQLKGKIPEEAFNKLVQRNPEGRTIVKFANELFFLDIDCRVGKDLQENDKEIFLPLIVNKFL